MNAAWVTAGGLIILFLGYRFYARYLARKVFMTEAGDDTPTPAEQINDGIDYVPTNRHVLFGHHFSSVAGAAPILGPAIAIVWGWLPALLWVVLGAVLMGAVHDYGSLVVSVKHGGKSIGMLTQSIIGPRAKALFLTVIFLLVWIVIAVFAFVIASLFVLYPGTVIPINFEIIVALAIGYYSRRKNAKLFWPSVLALISLYLIIFVGFWYPVHLPEWLWVWGSERMTWVLFLLIYGFAASVLPVWTLLQPRDYINAHQLLVGLLIIYIAIFVASPEMDAPAINLQSKAEGQMSWFPFLFITIACGAISGFHSLISSGTTSKQLARLKDARYIGYGGMIGEAALAIAATIAVAAGFESTQAWNAHYHGAAAATGMQAQVKAFVDGTASFLSAIGINHTMQDAQGVQHALAAVFVSVLVISFAATSLDTAVRLQRYIVGEVAEGMKLKTLTENRYLQTFIAVGLSLLLVLSDASGGGGLRLWPLFGATNQMVGSLSLLVISVWLYRLRRAYWFTLAPMILITLLTFIATVQNFMEYVYTQNWMLVAMAFILATCQLMIVIEGIRVFREKRAIKLVEE